MIVERLAKLWRVEDTLPETVDLIAVVAYGATATGLTKGSAATVELAKKLVARYPNAVVAYGVFSRSHHWTVEAKAKHAAFPTARTAGMVGNTIEEAREIAVLMPEACSVVFVTGECHSRTAAAVWKGAIPYARTYLATVPIGSEVDPNGPVFFMRGKWVWLLSNVARHVVLKIFGMRRIARIYQPTSAQ